MVGTNSGMLWIFKEQNPIRTSVVQGTSSQVGREAREGLKRSEASHCEKYASFETTLRVVSQAFGSLKKLSQRNNAAASLFYLLRFKR